MLFSADKIESSIEIYNLLNLGSEPVVIDGLAGGVVRGLAIHPMDGRLFTGGEDKNVRVWETQSCVIRIRP